MKRHEQKRMSTAEIFNKLTQKTQSYHGVGVDAGETGWEEVLQALQGVDRWKIDFLLYVYGDNLRCRHSFFAGLMREAMLTLDRDGLIERQEPGAIERMVLLAMVEWKHWNVKIFEIDRADHMGVSLSTWKRRYKNLYRFILMIPQQWEDEVMKIVTQRLR